MSCTGNVTALIVAGNRLLVIVMALPPFRMKVSRTILETEPGPYAANDLQVLARPGPQDPCSWPGDESNGCHPAVR